MSDERQITHYLNDSCAGGHCSEGASATPDELLIGCRAYQKQANTAPQGEAVAHYDCPECGGRKVRLATPEELARIDALVERAFRASDRSPRPTPIRGRFVRECD